MTTVVVFGGSGFLGRRLVRRLAGDGLTVRVAVRHPAPAGRILKAAGLDRVMVLRADVRDQATVAAAIAGADAVVNAVSAYVERGGETFETVHVRAPRRRREVRPRPPSPASCSSLASVLIPNRGRLTSAPAGAANGRSSENFRALRSSVRAPCSVRATRCSARWPTSRGCSRCCLSSAPAAPACSQSM